MDWKDKFMLITVGARLVAEKLVIQSNGCAAGTFARYSCARHRNVVGSRVSVVSLSLKQRKPGRITIINDRLTRFWFLLEQTVTVLDWLIVLSNWSEWMDAQGIKQYIALFEEVFAVGALDG